MQTLEGIPSWGVHLCFQQFSFASAHKLLFITCSALLVPIPVPSWQPLPSSLLPVHSPLSSSLVPLFKSGSEHQETTPD